ncbi:hypothetical protein GW17_00043087 [Ensete ventricosum]|nr:hypothetical protein GW17_00043087 [Ensete ventricosum]RZS27633.1 hypothetical protein BHM03_00061143 [Ensete ventricosum]
MATASPLQGAATRSDSSPTGTNGCGATAHGHAVGGGCSLQGRKGQPRGQGCRLQGRSLAEAAANRGNARAR